MLPFIKHLNVLRFVFLSCFCTVPDVITRFVNICNLLKAFAGGTCLNYFLEEMLAEGTCVLFRCH